MKCTKLGFHSEYVVGSSLCITPAVVVVVVVRFQGGLSHEGPTPMGGLPSVRIFLRELSP